MSTQKTPIFLTGATGYIGSTVLAHLLEHPRVGTFEITALVRSAEKAAILKEKFGVNTVVGTHGDHEKIEKLAENSHVVFNTGAADDEGLAVAILKGLKNRHTKTGDVPVLIHTSGAAIVADDARGEYVNEKVYNDLNIDDFKGLPAESFHRSVDLAVLNADVEGYTRVYTVIPPTVYGLAEHGIAKAGISNAHSLQIPYLIRAALGRKRAGVVGKGLARWRSVHVDELADLYVLIFDTVSANPDKAGHGWEGLYAAESGEHQWLDISRAIGQASVELGLADNAEPTPFTREELIKYWGSEGFGLFNGVNARVQGERAKKTLGWSPKKSTSDMLASIKPELIVLAKKQ